MLNLSHTAIEANVPLEAPANLVADFCTVAADTVLTITVGTAACSCSPWQHWCEFCITLNLDANLKGMADPIPVLQLYARCYRSGEITPLQHPVCSHMVEQALHAIGQMFAQLGSLDPWVNTFGHIDFCIQ